MHRSLKLSVLLALALGSTQATALELGQIRVKSALGQPLLAEIPLRPDTPAELRGLSVRLASPEDFARAGLGVSRPSVPLQFTVSGTGANAVIRITSAVPVTDPYLDLLVEVDSAAGRSLREFPILLDPPGRGFAGAPAKSTRAARPAAARPATSGTTAPASAPAAQAAQAAPRAAANGEYGPVQSGQTLSGIAREVAPAGVDPNQMLVALKQANPDAFYKDNINALKSGAVLRVPPAEQARALSAAAAMAEVRRQNSDWRNQATTSPTVVADAATRAEATSSPTTGAAGDRLALVPPKQGGKGGTAGSSEGKGNQALRQDLLRAQESLTTLQQQGADLKSRLKDLQDLNDKNQRLLALKDNEIAELQQKLAAARMAAGMPASAATAGASVAAASPATPATAPAAAASAPATVPAAAASAPAASVAAASSAPASAASTPAASSTVARPAAKPMVKRPPAPVAEEPWFMQPWVWYAAGGAVLVLLLVALMARRRKPAAEGAKPASSLADRFGSLHEEPVTSADAEQDELLDQLAEHPDDIGLHLELVSLYYERRDIEHFEAAAEAMHAHVSDPQQPEWLDVVAMGQDLVPNHPLFAGADVDAGHEEPAADTFHFSGFDEEPAAEAAAAPSFDLDGYAAGHEEPAATQASRPKVSEYHFDFDLTPRARQARDAAAAHANLESPAEADEPMAFDLDEASAIGGDATETPAATADEPATTWEFDAAEFAEHAGPAPGTAPTAEPVHEMGEFSDDPIDTKLDLARAYLDMGDADGARGMLEEVMQEGTQMQKDAAQRLLDSLA